MKNELQRIWDDPALLERWTNAQLDRLDAEDELAARAQLREMIVSAPPSLHHDHLAEALAAAQAGNINPLRGLYPHLADFLQAPPRGRGKHGRDLWGAYMKARAVSMTIDDVKRIRRLWREHFGRAYRTVDPTADAIAARRNDLFREEFVNLRKNRYRQKSA
jgi:hypothetical protein